MIGIDTLPTGDDGQPATVVYQPPTLEQAEVIELLEEELLDGAEGNAEGREADTIAQKFQSSTESPDDLMRRLEDEKIDWQRQLAAMKETLEAQDRKIEEDRAKRIAALEKKKSDMKSGLVSTKKAPATRTILIAPQAVNLAASQIPSVAGGQAWGVWPGMADFHNRRARNVAKVLPNARYSFQNGPSRNGNKGQRAITSGSASNISTTYGNVGGRMVSYTGQGQNLMGTTRGFNTMASSSGLSTPSYSNSGSMLLSRGGSGGGYPGQSQMAPTASFGTTSAQFSGVPSQAVGTFDNNSGWLGGSVSYVLDSASYMMGYPDAAPVTVMPNFTTPQVQLTGTVRSMPAASPMASTRSGMASIPTTYMGATRLA